MALLTLSFIGLVQFLIYIGIPVIESSNFPLEDCFSQDMDILMLFYDNGDLSDNIDQYTTSQRLFQHLLSSPYNKTTSRVLYTYAFDTFSETNPNIDINSWYFHTSLETLTNNSVGTNKQSFISTSGTQTNDALVPKIKFVRRFFSEMSGVREYATHIAVIFLDGTSLSYDEGRKIPSIIQQENTDIKIFVAVHGGKYDQQRNYFSDTIFLEKYDHVTTHYILIMAICKQCIQGWFPLEHTDSSDYLSCYQLLDSNLQISWYDAMRICNIQFGGHLAAIETQQELYFLQWTIQSNINNLRKTAFNLSTSSELVVQVYIGLNRDITSVAQRFQWSLRSPSANRPLVINNWLDGKPSGGYTAACGVWQFDWASFKNDSNFSNIEEHVNEGWMDVRCRVKLSRFSLCEVTLPRTCENKHLTIDPASRDSFYRVLDKGNFVIFGNNILSISANAVDIDFLKFLKHTHDVQFPVFDCMEESGDPRYIPYVYVCDNVYHCSNRKDESSCMLPVSEKSTCLYGTRLESDLFSCDDVNACRDGRGKEDCENQCSGIYCCDGSCLPLQWVNDGEIDCNICGYSPGRSINDESDIFNEYLQKNTTCALICNQNECVLFSQLNDGSSDCSGPEGPLDETIGKLESAETCRNILDHIIWAPRCVYVKDMYGAVIGCRDMSHLKDCTDFLCPEGYFKCPGTYCIPQHYVQDGNVDCPTGEEESNENIDWCSGNFACWNSTICLHPDLVCDGHPECPHQDDEVDCDVSCNQGFQCVSGTVTVSDYNISTLLERLIFFNSKTRYIDLSGIQLTKFFINDASQLTNIIYVNWSNCSMFAMPILLYANENMLSKLVLQYQTITDLRNSRPIGCIPTLENIRYFNLSYNKHLSVNYLKYNYLEVLDLSHTAQSYINTYFLEGLPNLKYLYLKCTQIFTIHKYAFSSQLTLNTLDLRGIPMNIFYENLLNNLIIKQHLYTDNFEMCCQIIRGSNIPDHVCHAPEEVFSSCFDLIKNNIHLILILVMAVLSVLENMSIIIYRVIWDRSILQNGNGLFMTNLCISDISKGVYLCIIVGADYKYRDVYVLYDKTWRESIICKFAGFLATLSSQTSIYFIFLTTLDRFLDLKFPFVHKKVSHFSKTIIALLSWIICFLLAMLPIVFKFEIYSTNAMCLGLPLTTQRLKGWVFSFSLFIVHNLCFVLAIACGQRVIFSSVSKNILTHTDTSTTSKRQADVIATKQLCLVAMFNFLCWFSVGIMGLLSLGDHEISNEVYAWTTVIILPIHSAANPILYLIPDLMSKWKKITRSH